MFLAKHVNDSEGSFGNLKVLNEHAFCSLQSIPLLVSKDVFNSTLLQLYLRESQAEIETQPCPQDGKQVLGSMAVKREDVRKGQHLERSSKHFSENKTVSKVKSNQKSL